MQALGSLHNWVEQWISGWITWCRNGRWQYLPIGEALSDAGLDPIGVYIYQRHISASQYISTRPIFDLSNVEERRKISLDIIISREQEGIWFTHEGRGIDKSYVERE